MRILDRVQPSDPRPFADAHRARQSRAVSVERDDQRPVEAAGVEGPRGVGLVMLDSLQLVEQAQVAQMGLELLLPALVIARRLPGPVARALLGEIA